jgi:hypothetical protein
MQVNPKERQSTR